MLNDGEALDLIEHYKWIVEWNDEVCVLVTPGGQTEPTIGIRRAVILALELQKCWSLAPTA